MAVRTWVICAGAVVSCCAALPAAAAPRHAVAISPAAAATARASIEQVLADGCAAYSRGDAQGYLQMYLPGPDTRLIARGQVFTGYPAIRDRQLASGLAPGTAPRLSVKTLQFAMLGPDNAVLTGEVSLIRDPTAPPRVPAIVTTLIFRRTAEGWRLLYDHTS